MRRGGRTATIAVQVVAWTVIVAVSLALAVAVVVPRVAGATPFTVLTGSMWPTYPPGTLVVVRPVDADDLRVGDAVTYQIESGRPTVVTHRIVEIATNLKGERTFRTQGDANDAADPEPVRAVQIRGRVWYSVPMLGRVNTWISHDTRRTATTLVAAGLLAYAGWMFAGALRSRRRSTTTTTGGAHR